MEVMVVVSEIASANALMADDASLVEEGVVLEQVVGDEEAPAVEREGFQVEVRHPGEQTQSRPSHDP